MQATKALNNKTKNQNTKPFRKLGFTYLETTEIVVALKKLMANYTVHYHKLRNFHWNVEGPDFFEMHQEFENEYNTVQKNIDVIAERIRVFGIKPSMTLNEMVRISDIEEDERKFSSYEMVKDILDDYKILHGSMLDVINAALETGDIATEKIITDFLIDLEKRHWMFNSWVKKEW